MKRDQTGHRGCVDIHCHILPGIDDGPEDMEGSLALAAEAVVNGVSHIIATPHARFPLPDDWFADRRRAYEALAGKLRVADRPIQVHLGAEVRADPAMLAALESKVDLMLAGSRFLLLELPFDSLPAQLPDILFKLRVQGITPVLAHPERSSPIQKDTGYLDLPNKIGCLAQVNSGSLTGFFGRTVRRTAIRLLTEGRVAVIGSDAHRAKYRGVDFREAVSVASKYIGGEEAQKLVGEGPAAIIAGSTLIGPPREQYYAQGFK